MKPGISDLSDYRVSSKAHGIVEYKYIHDQLRNCSSSAIRERKVTQ
jgi:hypothetical protein